MLAAIGGIIVAITGLVTALGKIALGIFREWLKLRDLEADNTIRTKNDEINTERTAKELERDGRLKAERTAARQKKEIAALKAQLKARVQP